MKKHSIKAIALISSGIDSPVAAWMMKEKGIEVIGLHFDNNTSPDQRQIEKTKRLCSLIGIKELYISKHGSLMLDVIKKINRRFTCIICKRLMLKVAEKLAEKEGARFLIMGDNLGQVASQTLNNMATITKAVDIEILRPLLCYDKREIMDIAKKIGTYDISIEKSGCCSLVPEHPATRSDLRLIEEEERKAGINYVAGLEMESLEKQNIIKN